jgi:hypothetical protein
VDILPDDTQATAPNTVRCLLREALALGETSLCTLVPEPLGGVTVTLNVATALLRGLDARQGSFLRLHLAPRGIHIMPVRGNASPR